MIQCPICFSLSRRNQPSPELSTVSESWSLGWLRHDKLNRLLQKKPHGPGSAGVLARPSPA